MDRLTPYPLTPIGCFFGIILSVVPVVSHLGYHSWNVGIWVYAFWIGTMNITYFVDTIVWHDNENIVVPAWCDIVTKLQTGAAIDVPACALVLCLHLFRIMRMRGVAVREEGMQRRCLLILDLVLTLGIPLLIMALWIIVQPYRFYIYEEIGCQSVGYSFAAYPLFYGPQLVFCLVAAVLTPLTIQKFLRHRNEINEALTHRSDDGLSPSKYIRVMIITCLTLLLDLPVLIIQLTTRIAEGSSSLWNVPYHNWAWVHGDGSISEIIQIPASIWGTFGWQVFTIKWNEWIYVLHAIVFFAIFGTTPEARRRYRRAWRYILNKIGLRTKATQRSTEGSKIMFSSNPVRAKSVRRGTFSFLTSTNASEGQFTDSTRSAGSMKEVKTLKSVMEVHQTADTPAESFADSALELGNPEVTSIRN